MRCTQEFTKPEGVRRNAFLDLDLCFHIVEGDKGLGIESEGLAYNFAHSWYGSTRVSSSGRSHGNPTNPERHWVALVTGYHWLLGWIRERQHLLPGAKHAFPQHPPPCPWHGKPSPFTLTQQTSPIPTQAPMQQLSPPAQEKWVPCALMHWVGGNRRRVSESCCARSARSEFSSPSHSPSAEHTSSPSATTELPRSTAIDKTRPNAILQVVDAIRFCRSSARVA